jgi:hypothetical protein
MKLSMNASMNALLRSLALAPIALALACEEPPPPPPKEDPPEEGCPVDVNTPTQDATKAEDLLVGATVEGHLCPFRDDDGYRVIVPAAGDVIVVHLSMTTNLTPVEPSYVILKDNGGAEAEPTGIQGRDPVRSAGEPVDFTGAHRIAEAGNYIVVVRDVEGDDAGFDNINSYSLTVNIVPDPDGAEPNNSPAEATPITTSATGVIATSGDEDWYAIDLPGAAQVIDVTVTVPDGSGVDHEAELWGSEVVDGATNLVLLQRALLAEADVAGELTARLRKAGSDGSAEGRVGEPYFLVVSDAVLGDDDSDQDAQLDPTLGTYEVALSVFADPDPNEGAFGNERVESPTVVSGGQTLNGALATVADTDVYKIAPPGGTTSDNPAVVVVTVTFDGGFENEVDAQLRMFELDPEDDSYVACSATAPCNSTNARTRLCLPDNGGQCGEVRMQRFISTTTFRAAYPMRTANPVYVAINDFGDEDFQETGGYTISFDVASDTDPGEAGDDFLVPNLEEAGYENPDEDDQRQQRNASLNRARVISTGLPALCPEDAPAAGCLDLVPNAAPVGFGFDGMTVDCADVDVAPINVTLTGRLTYEGDRDYFILEGYPARGYFGVDLDINIGASPIELAVFVYANRQLNASTLTAAQTGNCPENPSNQNPCAEGSVCVDGRCWTDGPSNAAVPNVNYTGDFGVSEGDCITTGGPLNGPLYIEVVDNGLNDFDDSVSYTINLSATCGCAAACETAQDFCQDGV